MRWRSEVSRFAPDRLEEFDELIADALNNPAPVQKAEQARGRRHGHYTATTAAIVVAGGAALESTPLDVTVATCCRRSCRSLIAAFHHGLLVRRPRN